MDGVPLREAKLILVRAIETHPRKKPLERAAGFCDCDKATPTNPNDNSGWPPICIRSGNELLKDVNAHMTVAFYPILGIKFEVRHRW
jgi:hypothetical protein